jgi:ubiquinone/menaquinone biosynthesis C-methylase UbiE
MIARTRESARIMGLTNVEVRLGDAEALPVETASVDVVISNGALNLAPDKERAYAEIARVLRPGGRLYLADVVAQGEISAEIRSDFELWAG